MEDVLKFVSWEKVEPNGTSSATYCGDDVTREIPMTVLISIA